MRFGLFCENQCPKPWDDDAERRILRETVEQVQLADRIGIEHAWVVEHHFLEEYSHSSAPEVLLAALAAQTRRIRLGFGIRQVIPAVNHPARTAEVVGMLDQISDGRIDFGVGEGATRMELRGFGVPAKRKRALCLEAAEQIANMMVMEPYPGYEGEGFSMPCRNVVPKPRQKPHPPMWLACTSRESVERAARCGLGVLAFAFVAPEQTREWVDAYYAIVKSEDCVPITHRVNANIAIVGGFSLHPDAAEARRRGGDGFAFFGYSLGALVAREARPGRSRMWEDFLELREQGQLTGEAPGIGTPAEYRELVRQFEAAGIDQMIFVQQGGKTRHEHICQSLELFEREVYPEFAARREAAEARKAEELAPYIEAALARKRRLPELKDDEIPVVAPSRERSDYSR